MKKRENRISGFKSKVVLEALQERNTLQEIARSERLLKVTKQSELSVSKQCDLLEVSRSSFYYVPLNDSSFNQELMKLIDIQYM